MPLARLVTVADQVIHDHLRERLERELRSPQDAEPQPVVIEQPSLGGTRVYVIWDQWAQMPLRERSELILEAYESVHGPVRSTQVMAATGLTEQEAKQMGIRWGPV